jgi:hypothetical protein
MTDNTDSSPRDRQALEAAYGKVWDEEELAQEFKVTAIIAPKVVVVRKMDGQVGSLTFQNQPRFYFNFQPNSGFGNA